MAVHPNSNRPKNSSIAFGTFLAPAEKLKFENGTLMGAIIAQEFEIKDSLFNLNYAPFFSNSITLTVKNIYGTANADTLIGSNGNDNIFGQEGDDILQGGLGNDTLLGGDGSDIFALASGQGRDTIEDFLPGTDIIGLSGGLSFSKLNFSGSDILFASEVLATLTGVDATTLTVSNFLSF